MNALQSRLVRIFLIDEHPLVRDGLKLRLRAVPNFEVVGEAGSVVEAMALLEGPFADVLLMDIGDKEMGNMELDAFIARCRHMAILVLSWQAPPSIVASVMRAGANGYLLKNTPAESLVDAVQTVATGGTCLGSGIAGRLFRSQPAGSELSRREREVLRFVGQGKPSKVIAQALGISLRTIESHRQSIKRKLQIDGHAALIKYAVERAAYPDGIGESGCGVQPSAAAFHTLRNEGTRLSN